MNIARVFPRKTAATPTDDLAFWGKKEKPGMFLPEIDECRVSVAFTYDLPHAERLAEEWRHVAPVSMGGPAFDAPGGDFVPGMYLKPGYVITSRGCPNRCWFCSVWHREGQSIRELPITYGNNVLDDNLLACSREHITSVFQMLHLQKYGRVMFTGGLEAARLKDWQIGWLRNLHPESMFFAYDTPDDLEPLIEAGKMLRRGGFPAKSHRLCCYVLIGYPGDSFDYAEVRLQQTIRAGFRPFAMLYRDVTGRGIPSGRDFRGNGYCRQSSIRKCGRWQYDPLRKLAGDPHQKDRPNRDRPPGDAVRGATGREREILP